MKILVSIALLALFLTACNAGNTSNATSDSTLNSTHLLLTSPPGNLSADVPPRDDDSVSMPSRAQEPLNYVDTEQASLLSEVDLLEQQLALIIGYGDTQALFALQRINQRLFSGTLSNTERNCMMNPDASIVVLDALCDPGYPITDGLLAIAFAVSLDAEQGRADNNATCRSSLMNGTSDQCQATKVLIDYFPLNLLYEFSGNGIEDPNISLTSKANNLSCRVTYDGSLFDTSGDPDSLECLGMISQLTESITARAAALSLSQMTKRGISISTRLRTHDH